MKELKHTSLKHMEKRGKIESYLRKKERQDDKADPVDNAGKLERIGNCWLRTERKKNSENCCEASKKHCFLFITGSVELLLQVCFKNMRVY